MLLVITEGPRKGLMFPLEDRPVTIGRDPSSTIAVEDSRASRRHALIEPDDAGGWMVRDLGSINQTFLNGTPISAALLKEGDIVRVASTSVRFQVPVEEGPEEISLDMDPHTIQLALRNSGELKSRHRGLSEALFQISMEADLELSPEEFLKLL